MEAYVQEALKQVYNIHPSTSPASAIFFVEKGRTQTIHCLQGLEPDHSEIPVLTASCTLSLGTALISTGLHKAGPTQPLQPCTHV